MKYFLYSLVFSALIVSGAAAQTSRIVSGSTSFSVKFVLGTCDGTFDAPKGSAVFDDHNPAKSSFNITIAASSFDTGNSSRDNDMKGEKYFHVLEYPEIHFKSTQVEKHGNAFQATGMLTIRDVSKTVTLPFEAKKTQNGYSLSNQFEINRLDYHIGKKDWKLKDIVAIKLSAEIR
jgi:polyisoprenoid-binding protein YceI